MSLDSKEPSTSVARYLIKFFSVFKKTLERLWYALTQEKIKQLKIEGATKVFLSSLETKEFLIKSGKMKVSIKALEQEPKQLSSQLLSELSKIK